MQRFLEIFAIGHFDIIAERFSLSFSLTVNGELAMIGRYGDFFLERDIFCNVYPLILCLFP